MTNIEDLQGKKIGILGFGKEGLATANFLLKNGLTAVVYDDADRESIGAEKIERFEQAGFEFILGATPDKVDVEVLFRSPGIKPAHPVLLAAKNVNTFITSQTRYFFKHSPARIIGITGTKGKGTTTVLIAEMLEKNFAGKVFVTGNIGKVDPFDLLPDLSKEDLVVFELSSFQLQDLEYSPEIAICLMVTSEHLDYHENLEEYVMAKASICRYQKPGDFLVFARDYEGSRKIAEGGQAKKVSYGFSENVEGLVIGDEVLEIHEGGKSFSMDVSARKLKGKHNLENIAAAVLVARYVGVEFDSCQKVIEDFKGLEHRLELVGEFFGVKFVNDSISTVPESAIAAVQAFTEQLHVILGGSDKKSDYTKLAEVLATSSNIGSVFLMGETAKRIGISLEDAGYVGKLFYCSGLEEIFEKLPTIVSSGDVVLLSPASASFGLFKNYRQRGEKFKELAGEFIK